MRDLFLGTYLRIKEMPLLLRFFFVISCFGILLVILTALPIASPTIDGEKMTYEELWSSGVGIWALVTGILLSVSAVGIFIKKGWARATFLAVFLVYAFIPQCSIQTNELFLYFAWIVVFGCYLFYKRTVRDYFST